MDSDVFFGVDGQRVPFQYDHSRLSLGAIVHVSGGGAGRPIQFAPDPHAGSQEYAVTWIAPSEWYVSLSSGWRVEAPFVDFIHRAVKEHLGRNVVERACANAAKGIRLPNMYKTSEFQGSQLNTIQTVVERLDLVLRLSSPDVARALSHHYEPLVVYLMLTCFDRLGQPADWLDFGAWLDARRTADEREKAVVLATSMDPVTASRSLYRRWAELYGMRSSFYRFLRVVLPRPIRATLLESINIHRLAVPPKITRLNVDDQLKEDWLMDLRNAYTHRAQFVAGIPRDPFFLEIISADTWTAMRQQVVEQNEWRSVDLRGWPEVLISTVQAGLADYLIALSDGAKA